MTDHLLLTGPEDVRSHPILFIHGWWGGPWVWEGFLPCFCSLGFDCHAINLNAQHGNAFEPIGKTSFASQLAIVCEAAEELGKPIVIGHSCGGLLAQKLVERFNLPACVLLGSAAPRWIFPLRSWPLLKTTVRHARDIGLWRPFLPSKKEMNAINLNCLSMDEQDFVYERMIPISGRLAFQVAVWGVPVDATRIRTPMLVINGKQDRLTPPAVAKAIARKYQAEYREYPENAHYIMRESNRSEIAGDIYRWLCRTISV